jgi:hypothetical protein
MLSHWQSQAISTEPLVLARRCQLRLFRLRISRAKRWRSQWQEPVVAR